MLVSMKEALQTELDDNSAVALLSRCVRVLYDLTTQVIVKTDTQVTLDEAHVCEEVGAFHSRAHLASFLGLASGETSA